MLSNATWTAWSNPRQRKGRQGGGDDAASARYIFTTLKSEVKILFNEIDNKLLNYIDEDGTLIEPDFYVPVIPMLLLNGSTGIGTGWSTNIPCFKLDDIIYNIITDNSTRGLT